MYYTLGQLLYFSLGEYHNHNTSVVCMTLWACFYTLFLYCSSHKKGPNMSQNGLSVKSESFKIMDNSECLQNKDCKVGNLNVIPLFSLLVPSLCFNYQYLISNWIYESIFYPRFVLMFSTSFIFLRSFRCCFMMVKYLKHAVQMKALSQQNVKVLFYDTKRVTRIEVYTCFSEFDFSEHFVLNIEVRPLILTK